MMVKEVFFSSQDEMKAGGASKKITHLKELLADNTINVGLASVNCFFILLKNPGS